MVSYQNRYLIVFGGASQCYEAARGRLCLNDLYVFDTVDKRWELKSRNLFVPSLRMNHVAGVLGNIMIVHGGYNAETGETLDAFHLYDIDLSAWISCKVVAEDAGPETAVSYLAILN